MGLGIINGAMAGLGQGLEQVGQTAQQQIGAQQLAQMQSDLAFQKQASLLDIENKNAVGMLAAKSANEDAERKQQAARIAAAAAPIQNTNILKNAGNDSENEWVPIDAKVNPDGTAVAGTPTIAPTMADLSPADLQQYAETPEQHAQSMVLAATNTGDLGPQTQAQLAMQDAAMKRAEAAQAAQFAHSDASQAASQNFQAQQQAKQIAATAANYANSRSGQGTDDSSVTPGEKSLAVSNYISLGGRIPYGAPKFIKDNVTRWASEAGITPDDISKGIAQRKFDLSAAGTAGNRSGSLATVEQALPGLTNNAISLANKLDQGKFVPMNKLMQMGEGSISDPTLSALKVAHMDVVSEYQLLISRGGVGNVTALNHAMDVLNMANSPQAYASALNQVKIAADINTAASANVRKNLGNSNSTPLVGTQSSKPSLNDIFGQ